MAFLAGITEELAPTGLALTLLSAAPQGDIVPARDVAVDGAIVYSCNPDSSAVGWLMRRRLPLGVRGSGTGTGHRQRQHRRPARRASRRPAHHRLGTSTRGDRDRRLWRRVRGPDRSPGGNHRIHRAATATRLARCARRGRYRAHRRAPAPRQPRRARLHRDPDAPRTRQPANRHPLFLRRHRPRRHPRDPGRRPACTKRRVRRRLRRQPHRPTNQTCAHHRASRRRRQGPSRSRRTHHRNRPRQDSTRQPRPTPRATHRTRRTGQHHPSSTRFISATARRASGRKPSRHCSQTDRLSHTDGTGRPWLKAGQDNHGGGASGVDQAESIRSTKLQPRSRSTAPDTRAKVRTTPRITGPSTRW